MTHHLSEAAHTAALAEAGAGKDPVCGMTVSSVSRFHEVYQGRTYLFCSERCLAKFRAAPSSYANTRENLNSV
ncbi:MAG: YHS domain-containing protein [Nitrosomonadales bacterium]|nr:YHS domain-containing protein [Nitrosomonadales bacterium]